MKILVVDPSTIAFSHIQAGVHAALKSIEPPPHLYSISHCHSLLAARIALSEEHFDLVFVDAEMENAPLGKILKQLFFVRPVPIVALVKDGNTSQLSCFEYDQVKFMWMRNVSTEVVAEVVKRVRK